jgi:hypothetical protein
VETDAVILLSEAPASFAICAYAITFGPGVIRYLSLASFFKADINDVITQIRQHGLSPVISTPYTYKWEVEASTPSFTDQFALELKLLDSLPCDSSWEGKLRLHHALGRLVQNEGMPSYVYCGFHTHLDLGEHFALTECLDSWVKGTSRNNTLACSYLTSPDHIVFEFRDHFPKDYCVFKKTEFVIARLAAISQKAARQAEEATQLAQKQRKIEEEQRTLADLETLRKSRFQTFVYLMEDARNGAFKIGRSRSPGKRERTLQSEAPGITLRFSIPADEADERHLQVQFASKRLRGEWFSLTPDDLLQVIQFLKANGDIRRAFIDHQWLGVVYFKSGTS